MLDTCEVAIDFHALSEESEHVVPDGLDGLSGFHFVLALDVSQEWPYMFEASLCLGWTNMHRELSTAQVISKWCWRVKYQAAVRDQFPSFFQAGGFPDQLEIVDINTEDQLELLVDEQAFPSRDMLKVAFQQFLGEMILPVFP